MDEKIQILLNKINPIEGFFLYIKKRLTAFNIFLYLKTKDDIFRLYDHLY